MTYHIRFKKGVIVRGVQPEMVAAWPIIASVYAEFGAECVITSVCDGEHESIVHSLGFATDFRTRNVRVSWREKLAKRVKDCLTDEYDVVLEKTHLHCEVDSR